ncbi:MAG: hypothetical protein SGI74_07965 [Oligoflexia bacterium]|nr:hypothetical protein [Oligoflexia bacterium]
MAEEKKEETAKKSATDFFREKLSNKEQIKETVLEGLKSTNSRVRALAVKTAFKLQDHPFVKKNVMPLIQSDKSKKVLRTLSQKVTRKDLVKKMDDLIAAAKKAAAAKKEAADAPPADKV